jgi:hypothetical protein
VTATAVAATSLLATGGSLSPASADVPDKVAWWNLSGAPSPTTPAGGLRVSVASQQTIAFGAVAYRLPTDGTATLELSVAQMSGSSSEMLNAIVACPTKDDSWKPGDDQDASTGPAWDCSAHHFNGHLDSTGATLTFLVDGAADQPDGELSLAIVPVHSTSLPAVGTDPGTGLDVTPPFFIDFNKPSSSSFTQTGGSSAAAPPPPPTPAPASSTGSGTAAPPSGASINVPPATTTNPGQSPVIAPAQPAAQTPATTPAAATAPADSGNDWKHNLLLLLVIALVAAWLYGRTAPERAPRSLVPARTEAGRSEPAPATVVVGVPRGLGRFAKPRAERARPLV